MILTAAKPCLTLRRSAVPHKTCRRSGLRVHASAGPDWAGKQFTLLSTSADATAHLASLLAEQAEPGDAYCLKGDLGAGKTAFCQGFVRAATGATGNFAPPSRSIVPNEYSSSSGLPLLHFDVSGLSRPSDADCEQLVNTFPNVVSLIEDAEQLRQWGAAPEQRLALYFRRLPAKDGQGNDYTEANVRLVTIMPHTGMWEWRTRLLHANLAAQGAPEGLVMLSDEMAATLLAGLPESPQLVKA